MDFLFLYYDDYMENQLHILNGYTDELFPVNICVVKKYSILPQGSGFKSLHWHEDLQFVLCTKGFLRYQINGIEYTLKERQALFINKGALHLSNDMSEAGEYVTLTFPEDLLCFFKESRMKYKYVWPYTRTDFLRCYEIRGNNEYEQHIIEDLFRIVELNQKASALLEYDISIYITKIWRNLVLCLQNIEFVSNKKDVERQERVQVMLVYIHTHYSGPISLKDIADAGVMSIAQCNRCFNKMLNVTPYEYLLQYRLQKGMDFLRDASLNVTEISEKVGFNSVTHFIQAFKKEYGMSPKKYRMGV